ncbi:MAG: tRNA (adenosine(37)-N6)-threonylcarbamoyltransferase complex dimerization subunit type 1 TsaB [bacterium]
MILIIDTADSEKAFLGIWEDCWLQKYEWTASRNLSADILVKLQKLFSDADKNLKKISGIIVNSGPGSFTGLRIGISVANTLAYSLDVPIVGVSKTHEVKQLLEEGLEMILRMNNFVRPITPEYGREPNISQSKKKH